MTSSASGIATPPRAFASWPSTSLTSGSTCPSLTSTAIRPLRPHPWRLDLEVHLFPCLLLLQLGAKHITVPIVVVAYALTRLWFMWATTHHVSLNWPLLTRHGRVSLRRTAQGCHPWPTHGVLNDIYGLKPHLPPSMARWENTNPTPHDAPPSNELGTPRFGYTVEASAMVLCLAIASLPQDIPNLSPIFPNRNLRGLPQEIKEATFFALGAGNYASQEQLSLLVCVCGVGGLAYCVVMSAIEGFFDGGQFKATSPPARPPQCCGPPCIRACVCRSPTCSGSRTLTARSPSCPPMCDIRKGSLRARSKRPRAQQMAKPMARPTTTKASPASPARVTVVQVRCCVGRTRHPAGRYS